MKSHRLLHFAAPLLLMAGVAGAQTVFNPGVLRHQVWTSDNPNGAKNPSRQDIEAGVAGLPATDVFDLTNFDTIPNVADNYGERVSGLFIPPTTGNYVFFVCSDDDSDLFLSTDESAANKRVVAQETGWSNPDQWTATGSGPTGMKRSDQWQNLAGQTPYASGIPLTAGQKYWIEAIHHEGGGGDDLGVNYKLVGDADPANGTASKLTGALIGYGYTIPSSLTVVTQINASATAFAGQSATFRYEVFDPLPDPLVYSWYKNNVLVAGTNTGPYFTFQTTAADNGAQVYCIVSLPASYSSSLSITSSVATVNVTGGSQVYTNGLKVEFFSGATRSAVEAGNVPYPDGVSIASAFEMPANDSINNYTRKVSGWFIAPQTANYTLWVASDDDSDLFWSPDADPAHKQIVAQETVWSNPDEWTSSGGGSLISQKESDTFSPDLLSFPYGSGLPMTAGQMYYIEGVQHQGGGGDNFSVLYTIWGDVQPTNGTLSNLRIASNNIAYMAHPSSTLNFTVQPQDVTVFDQQTATFTAKAVTDSELSPIYQWYRNNQVVTNATGSAYSFVASGAVDDGAQYFVTAQTVLGGLSATSSVVTLHVNSSILEYGFAKVEKAPAAEPSETQIQNGDVGPITQTYASDAFAAGVNNGNGDNYGRRVSGYFIPPTSGNYTFITCSDDQSALFLSTDETPSKKVWIAYESQWSNPYQWNTYEGGTGSDSQKNSNTFTNSSGVTPYPNGVPLTAGQKYYMEVDEREGGGGDNVEVTYYTTGGTPPADGTASVMTGNVIAMSAPRCSYVALTNQPVSVTVTPPSTATFTAEGTTDSQISVGGTGVPNLNNYLIFQWTRNGTNIPGATGSSYTTPNVGPWDNNEQFMCKVRALGFADSGGNAIWSNSQTATLTVNVDSTPPAIVYAGYYTFTNVSLVGQTFVTIKFNKVMDPSTLIVPGNYTIPGLTVVSATVNSNSFASVTLEVTGTPTFPLSLTLNGIKDGWGTVPAVTTASVGNAALVSQDIGTPGVPGTSNDDPAIPTRTLVDGTNAYTVMCEGSDIWGQHDGFNFLYEVKTGDFDVAVRQKSTTHTSNWSKGGLMVRETLDNDSRNWNIVNDPLASDGIPAPDGSGNGANVVETNWRTNGIFTGAESQAWNIIPQTNSPAYPNAWLRLKRSGTIITAMLGTNGRDWIVQGAYDVSTNFDNPVLPDTLYVGICTTAHNNDNPNASPLLYVDTAMYADYESVYVPTTAPNNPTLTLGQQGGVWKITYTGTLQSSSTVNGTYTDVNGAASPYTVPTGSGTMQFYRARN